MIKKKSSITPDFPKVKLLVKSPFTKKTKEVLGEK